MPYKSAMTRSIGEALSSRGGGEDSPVMNETLSVIDEHITEISTPRQSLQPSQRMPDDSESEYSSHLDRVSFLAGPETEDEDSGAFSKEEVSRWDQKQTADHLRSLGVDSRHCDIFEEQEITGEVLLDMDQSFIQMKEFDFGVMGKRLKTWHKIRDFQRDVRGRKSSRQSSLSPLNPSSSIDDLNRASPTRITSGSTILPRIPSLNENHGIGLRQTQHAPPAGGPTIAPLQTQGTNAMQRTSLGATATPSAWRSSMGLDSPAKLAALDSKDGKHSRRHSSIDFGQQPDMHLSSTSLGTASTPNKQKSSFDRDWSGGEGTPASTNITSPSVKSKAIRKQESLDMSTNSPLFTDGPNLDLERGYFSGNEVDNRKARNVLRKSYGSPVHSRQSSLLDEPRKAGPSVKRHSRLSSVDSSRDPGPLVTPASKAYHSSSFRGRFRSASAQGPTPRLFSGGYSPTVTNLENEVNPPLTGATSVPSKMTIPAKARKLMGMRAASEGVTPSEKVTAGSSNITSDSLEESPVASPNDSHTPSITSQSMEVDDTDKSSKGTDHPGSIMGPRSSQRARPKSKHQTSAYSKGLLKLTPEQARKACDYHGWMKKKSSSLVTTWKPRLFILRGRRLSYYYSEDDTEERGIIDISGHKVLVANSDPMATLHATLTGAKASPSSAGTSGETSPTVAKPPNVGQGGPFYFKLVPPKVGLSRAVQFTRPTVYYFQVDTPAEGRKWMGEIMKATIEHDLTGFESTNKQKTISLAKARARKERPPALKEAETATEDGDAEKKPTRESGLNIKGLGLAGSDQSVDKSDVENVEPKVEEEEEEKQTTETVA
jgi:PH domain/SAM domain (Sterile alpha motif)